MNKPTCAMWEKDYVDQWTSWILHQVELNCFKTLEDCMKYIMTQANGRVNPSIIKRVYEEFNK